MDEQLELDGFSGEAAVTPAPPVGVDTTDTTPEADKALVARLIKTIKADKQHWAPDFKRMREDMQLAKDGDDSAWVKAGNYVANITGRHINQSVAALYAKNPTVIARRRPRMDFVLWDENPQSLQEAFMLVQAAQQMMAATPPMVDPMTGAAVPPMLPPEIMEAQALLQDIQEGLAERAKYQKLGKTLETLFAYFMQEQQPLDFKTAAKQAVRRAKTTGVAYLRLAFQRVMQPQPESFGILDDATQQFDHIRRLSEAEATGDLADREAEQRELELARQTMAASQQIILREGLVFDWPESTRVIPDRLCRQLVGFVGARHLTVEFLYTAEEVKEIFGVDLKMGDGSDRRAYLPYTLEGMESKDENAPTEGLVCVWEHYDKPSGNVYYLADGHDGFLKPPGPPDVRVEGFWPVYALCFNQIEHDTAVFPPSDVRLIKSAQREYNNLRQGQSEHRKNARPRFYQREQALSEPDMEKLGAAKAWDVVTLAGLSPTDKLENVFGPIPVPGVDPNLYQIAEALQDLEMTVGASETSFGAAGKATATGESLAEGARSAAVSSNVDDLDAFLTAVARAAGQILMLNMSAEQVTKIVGRGAFWPEMSMEAAFEEIGLEIEAGSSGRPNKAQEIANWEKLLPMLIQLPNVSPTWVTKETIKRLDDRADLTEAVAEGIPSIVSMNRMSQAAPADPNADPQSQGEEGGNNGPPPPGGPVGTDAPMGNNQI